MSEPIQESSQCNVCGATSPLDAVRCVSCGLTLPSPRERELRALAESEGAA